MTRIGMPAPAAALAIAALTAAAVPSTAATRVHAVGVGQHAAVMNSVRRAQLRDDAISHVQDDIRSTKPKRF